MSTVETKLIPKPKLQNVHLYGIHVTFLHCAFSSAFNGFNYFRENTHISLIKSISWAPDYNRYCLNTNKYTTYIEISRLNN